MNVKGEAIEGAVALRSKGVILSSPGEILLGSEEIKLHMTGGVHRMLSGHAWGEECWRSGVRSTVCVLCEET